MASTDSLQVFFLATISTVTVVSNWSFRSFRNRLDQQQHYSQHNYPQPSHDPSRHTQPLQLHQNSTPGYYNAQYTRPAPMTTYDDKENAPLLLESPRSMDFVTERSRERESNLRTPSPSKRGRRFV